ncbi:MAG: YafY family transcriptional regulator [Saprospiraceae bacterium]|nr:YafY family transcriptional regulator [Saprospiraceae bacterium]
MNRIDRISAILIQLQSKRIVKAQEIADRFEISLRTVYRDMRSLQETGVPIISEAGTGYSLAEGYKLQPVSFTMDEITTFLMAEKLLEKLSDQQTYSKYQSALFKIKAILKYAEKDQIDRIDDNIQVLQNFNNFSQDTGNAFTQTILIAIGQKKSVHLDYFALYNETTSSRDVEPLGIYYSAKHWYVIAYCLTRKDYRNFRIDRIKSASINQNSFIHEHPSLKTYLANLTKEDKELIKVVLQVENRHAQYLNTQKYYLGFVNECRYETYTEMTFLTSSLCGFARWYVTFGDAAEILEPESLKEEILSLTSKIAEKLTKESVFSSTI